MATLCDEIEVGIATSFLTVLFNETFMEIRLIFMISIIIERAPRATVFYIFA